MLSARRQLFVQGNNANQAEIMQAGQRKQEEKTKVAVRKLGNPAPRTEKTRRNVQSGSP
jgi:hypothetical protein